MGDATYEGLPGGRKSRRKHSVYIRGPCTTAAINILMMSVSPGTSFLPTVDEANLAYLAFLLPLNKTLHTPNTSEGFPINPKPFLGKFQGTSLDLTKGVTVSLTYTITVDKGFPLASDPTKLDQDLMLSYIGEPLILLSRPAVTSESCLIEHTGLEYCVF